MENLGTLYWNIHFYTSQYTMSSLVIRPLWQSVCLPVFLSSLFVRAYVTSEAYMYTGVASYGARAFSISNNKIFQLTSEPHEVYKSQLYVVSYSITLWKRVKSVTWGVLLRFKSTKIVFVFVRGSTSDPPSRPILHPIDAFDISVSASQFVLPSRQILQATPLVS